MDCPEPDALVAFAEGRLAPVPQAELRAHLDACDACREVLVALVRTSQPPEGAPPPAPWDVPLPGSTVGRFVVQEVKGAGAMGLVLAARDPALERRVALKLLRPDLAATNPSQGEARLIREAQLMARVRHPNVLAVFDVVEHRGQRFIAMDLAEGQTVREWLEAQPRAEAEVLRVFLGAARGLGAAHAAGVVHRDFKPDNVLLGADGEALVCDFGLAWSHGLAVGGPAVAGVASGLSRSSSAIGTPAYMAPEQLRGEGVSAASDQFSFCVALFEALTGARPFAGDTVEELLAAIDAGALDVSRLPRRLGPVLRRGLSAQPEERHPSMEALAAALAARTRWRAAPLLAAGVIAGLVALTLWRQGPGDERCAGPARDLAAAWSGPVRDALTTAMRTAPTPRATTNASFVTARLDEDAQHLGAALAASCAPGAEAESASRTLLCVEERLNDLQLLVALFRDGDPVLVEKAPLILERFPGGEGCLAGELVSAAPLPRDVQARARVRKTRERIARADVLRISGKLDDAQRTAESAHREARGLHRPLEADALLALAEVQRARGHFNDAATTLGEALLAAEAGRHFEAIARISVQHILVLGTQTMRPAEAEPWVRRAYATLEQLPRPRLRAEVDVAVVLLRLAQDRPEEALAVAHGPLETLTAQSAPASRGSVAFLAGQAAVLLGRHGDALRWAREAVALRTTMLGADSPLTLRAELLLGSALAGAGEAHEAIAVLEPALQRAEAAKLPPLAMAAALAGLARAHATLGHPDAIALVLQAEQRLLDAGPLHARYVGAAERLAAELLRDAGRFKEASIRARNAKDRLGAALGPTHRETRGAEVVEASVFAMLELPVPELPPTEELLPADALLRRLIAPGLTADEARAAESDAAATFGPTSPEALRARWVRVRLDADASCDDVLAVDVPWLTPPPSQALAWPARVARCR